MLIKWGASLRPSLIITILTVVTIALVEVSQKSLNLVSASFLDAGLTWFSAFDRATLGYAFIAFD